MGIGAARRPFALECLDKRFPIIGGFRNRDRAGLVLRHLERSADDLLAHRVIQEDGFAEFVAGRGTGHDAIGTQQLLQLRPEDVSALNVNLRHYVAPMLSMRRS